MSERLDGKVALVTGGARGLGRVFARALGQAGAAVALLDVTDGTEAALAARGRFFEADVSDPAAVGTAVEAVLAAFGTVDILVNNAAVFADLAPARYDAIEPDLWDRVMAVNVRGAFLMTRAVGPVMEAKGSGRIINVTSGTVYKGMPGMVHYVASKGALAAMTRALSRELGASGICVNSLAPGLTLSTSIEANAEHVAAYQDRVIASRAIQRHGYPQDLVGALLFLAGDASGFVTGQTIVVDGGSVNT